MTTAAAATQDDVPAIFRARLEGLIQMIRPVSSTGDLAGRLIRAARTANDPNVLVELVPQDERFRLSAKGLEALPGIADAIERAASELEEEEDVLYSGPVYAVNAYRTLVVAGPALRRAAFAGPESGYSVAVGVEHLLRNALELVPATAA